MGKILADIAALLTTQDNLFLRFYLSVGKNIKRLEYHEFFVLLTALMCFDSIFNLLERDTDDTYLFSCKTLVFFF